MMGSAREGGLLLTEEKCCRLSSEYNCTEFVIRSCFCVCLLQVCIHACLPFLLYTSVFLWVCMISTGLVPA